MDDSVESLRIRDHLPLQDEDPRRVLARMRAGQKPLPEEEPEGWAVGLDAVPGTPYPLCGGVSSHDNAQSGYTEP